MATTTRRIGCPICGKPVLVNTAGRITTHRAVGSDAWCMGVPASELTASPAGPSVPLMMNRPAL